MPPLDPLDNPFLRFLEGKTPEAFLFAQLPQDPSIAQQSFASSIFQPLLNRFRGEIGRRALAGEAPDPTFQNFLGQNFDFGRQFRRFGPQSGTSGPIRRVF